MQRPRRPAGGGDRAGAANHRLRAAVAHPLLYIVLYIPRDKHNFGKIRELENRERLRVIDCCNNLYYDVAKFNEMKLENYSGIEMD